MEEGGLWIIISLKSFLTSYFPFSGLTVVRCGPDEVAER